LRHLANLLFQSHSSEKFFNPAVVIAHRFGYAGRVTEVAIAIVEVGADNFLKLLRDSNSLLQGLAKDLGRDRCGDYERFDSHFGWLFLMLDWSSKERAYCRLFLVVLQAQSVGRISNHGNNNI